MKHVCILLLVSFSLLSCVTDTNSDDVDTIDLLTNYDAITLDRPTFEASVTLEDARTIVNSGKIYVLNGLLFVNEKNKGFHIFDNENPSSPIALAYIKAPGATDLAIKNNVYYINQAVDLIAVTYDKQTANLQVTKRIREVFPSKISPDGFIHDIPNGEIIIDYELED
ncbi:hypothetical protein [Dokdonia sp. R86516]|uniref:hypothetical protein n=1 Tax=Dokdonia sp. R86516 TaxID=3093856 RepID=UPI0037CB79DF